MKSLRDKYIKYADIGTHMKITFRQGIVSHQTGGFLQTNGSGNIDLLATNRAVTVSLAHHDADYTHSEDNTVASAWTGPFTPSTSYYLYWDFNLSTFTRTFGKTLLEPVAQSIAPGSGNSPIVGVVPGIASPAFGSFEVDGHYVLPATKPFAVVNSTGNDGLYTVQSATYNLGSGTTTIVVNEDIPDATVDGALTLDLDYNGDPLYVDGRTWFDTTNNIHYILSGTTWVEIFRVYAAQVFNGTFISLSQLGIFTGTQIGNNNAVFTGRVLFSETGNPPRRDGGTFFTTEDQFFTNQSRVDALRLEANVSRAQSASGGTLAAFEIVAWSDDGQIMSATYNDTGSTVVGVLTEILNTGEVGAVIVQGTVTNSAWNWIPGVPVGSSLWIDNGALVTIDPHVADPIAYTIKQVPVARVLSTDTIIFEQGLGGIGPQGPIGEAADPPFADFQVFGVTSIEPTPAVEDTPVAVGTNHPVIVGGPYAPTSHTHTALEINTTAVGNVTNTILQNVIAELDTKKLSIALGGTLGGILTLSGPPVDPLDAVTKSYVDSGLNAVSVSAQFEQITIDPSQEGDTVDTNVPTTAAAGSPLLQASIQVFRSGILQIEDLTAGSPISAGSDFIVSGPNQLTFAIGLLASDMIIIYVYS